MYLESLMLLGKKQQMWLTKFKIALIQKDAALVDALLNEVPHFSNKEDMEEAMYLMREGVEMMYSLQDDVSNAMHQIKKNVRFLKSSIPDSQASFNIKY